MTKYIRTVISTLLISATLFLVACTGSITEAGDRLEGKGSATISQNGEIEGQGEGKSHSKEDGDHDDDDDHDDDHHSHRKLKFKMKNPTDKIVCTSATGQVTVYGRGDDINKTATATCVVTPASQVPATATASGSSGGTSGTTTTTSSSSTGGTSGGTSGAATTTTTTGTNTASSSAASSTSATPNPANSF